MGDVGGGEYSGLEDSRVGSRQFVVFQNLWCFRIYVCLLSSYDERVASSVAEPEPVGAELLQVETEPVGAELSKVERAKKKYLEPEPRKNVSALQHWFQEDVKLRIG